ncbi:MAG TPA: penicillin-binding transpeptidase domain-containing protein [Pseudobacteroides sp.]|mgnify:FL=1|nr:penicillin-binding transpeptidase domain-containing protein [Pseudobacteroides sp.]
MTGISLSIKKRLLIVLLFFLTVIILLLVRLVFIQIINGEWYQQQAYEQQNSGMEIAAGRGTIYDRNGNELAVSASVETVSINPQEIRRSKKDKYLIAKGLSEILSISEEDVLKKIDRKSRYERVVRKVDKDVGDKVRKWIKDEQLSGIYVVEDTKRFYPNRNLAAHVIGFTGTDNQGLDGIEATMDKYLKGTSGKILSEVDAGGREIPSNEQKHIAPKKGNNVVLTIDETIQYLAEKALEKAIKDYKILRGATAIVMDPRNGDILALTSKPDFDLNNPFAAPEGVDASQWKGTTKEDIETLQKTVWRNKAVVDTYEPGSTFKAVTSAAGLEEGVVKPDTPVSDATVRVGGWNINCWRPNAHGNETFTEGVYNSCNPVFVRVSQALGIERFYSYVRKFGFFDKTNIDLPGEAKSVIHKKPTEVDMAAASFGQRFQITPIQLITAYGAIANGGTLYKPRLVKELTDDEGNVVKTFESEPVRTVITKETAQTLRTILEGVVSEGTGGNAYVKGYRLAGKTGTSETLQTKKEGRYIASFMSFAPADDPVICALVVLDHPDVYPHTGGMVAAPVAGKLVEDILNYLEVPRRYTEKDKDALQVDTVVPEVTGLSFEDAKKMLNEKGLTYEIVNKGNTNSTVVVEQMPKPDAIVPEKTVVLLYTYKPETQPMVTMPDIMNKTIDEAAQTLKEAGLNIKAVGLGVAVEQSYQPGTKVAKGQLVEVIFRKPDVE